MPFYTGIGDMDRHVIIVKCQFKGEEIMHLNLKNDIDNTVNNIPDDDDLNSQKQFWRNMFEEPTEMCELLKSGVADSDCAGTYSVIETSIGNVSCIHNYCSSEGIDRRSYYTAAFAVVLGNACRQTDVTFGTELPSKHDINKKYVVPVRVDISSDISLSDHIYAINNMLCEAADNSDIRIDEILAISGHSTENELFRSVFKYHKEEDFSYASNIPNELTKCKYGSEIIVEEKNDSVVLKVIYDQSMYSAIDISVFIDHVKYAAENMAVVCDKKLSEFEIITAKEKSLILDCFNNTMTDYPRDKTVVELFEEQVKKTPDNIALVFENKKLTYAELNAKANSLAHKLRELGVKPDDFVAIIADKSVEVIAGIFGILKSGGAYVPVDPKYPSERIRFMLEDCEPKAIIKFTTEDVQLPEDVQLIDLANADIWSNQNDDPDRVNTAHDLAYCIYTSGTTGKPKGVMIEHYGVANLREYFIQKQGVCEKDNVIQFASISFDAAVSEMTMGLLCGATMHMIPAEIQKDTKAFENYIADNKISIAILPPVYLTQINLKGLRTIITAGSETNKGLVEANKHIPVYSNDYGPTEGTVCATFWKHDSNDEVPDRIPIGKPMNNKQIYIMNGDTLCGIGVPGELCIAGEGLARGYLNRPELTAEKFVKNPFGEGRMYRSGDLARWLPDGNIEYLGRIDEQVKIRGFRIELGEIESRIREIENINDCAVIAKEDGSGEKTIYAYYTSDSEMFVSEVRERLAETLPEYMVPAYMMQIAEIPVTRNGKVDRRALPEIEAKATREYVAPRNEIEEKICDIFSEILNVDQVGIKDSFFELGGHSLRATRLVNKIEAETGTRLSLKTVFAGATPELLAVALSEDGEEYTPIPKAGVKKYYPMSSVQRRMFIIDEVGADLSYNLPEAFILCGKLDIEKFRKAVNELVERHDAFRTEFGIRNGEYVQVIKDRVDFDIDIRTIEEAGNRSVRELFFDFVKPFDLTKAPIARIQLIKYSDDKFLVMYDMHHIIFDGMSQIILMEEFIDLYNGKTLEPLKLQYKDYSTWFSGIDLSKQRGFWMDEFEDGVPIVELPTDYPRPQKQSFKGNSITINLSDEVVSKIEKLSRITGATEYMVWLSVLMIVLSKYSRQEDIVVGSPISGRTNRDTEGIVGMFVNTLAMRGKPEGNKSFREFLGEIKETCLRVYENQDYPFESLVEALDINKDSSRNPVFDVMFVLQNNEPIDRKINGISEYHHVTENGDTSMFDLTIEIKKYPEASLRVEYCTELFRCETIEYFTQHYIGIISQVIDHQGRRYICTYKYNVSGGQSRVHNQGLRSKDTFVRSDSS